MSSPSNRINVHWMPASGLASSALLSDPRTLGIATLGAPPPMQRPDLPCAHLRTPVIDGAAAVEVFSGRLPARAETIGATHCRHNGEVLFAAVSMPVGDDNDDAMGVATHAAYRALIDALHAAGYPHLLRVWNSIPQINEHDGGLERYRRFNLGRHRAFTEANQPTMTGAPAACALGSMDGPLVLYCLAAKAPPLPIENPRQVSAYHYPQQYGPRAPSFSRAALWSGADGAPATLFVSGTASIVGHQTLHVGDVTAQTRETLTNLLAVAQEAKRQGASNVAHLSDLQLKAYLRRPADAPQVRAVLREHDIDAEQVLMLHADICRAELLMEIEAIGPISAITPGTTDTRGSASHPNSDSRALQETD